MYQCKTGYKFADGSKTRALICGMNEQNVAVWHGEITDCQGKSYSIVYITSGIFILYTAIPLAEHQFLQVTLFLKDSNSYKSKVFDDTCDIIVVFGVLLMGLC